MVSAIHAYMDEKITAFQFDDVLAETISATKDKTMRRVGQELWYHYDDVKDHKIVACKEEWDYFNRLLLLLQSDGEIELVNTTRQWRLRQAVAATCLGAFGLITLQTGFGDHLFVFAMPFGVVSMVIAWMNSREQRKRYYTDSVITPFPSVSSLFYIRRRVRGFKKKRYPKAIMGRRIRDPFIDRAMIIPWGIIWLMFSPIPLFFQMLPKRECETRINMPEQAGASNTQMAST